VIEDVSLEAKILLEPFDADFYDLKSEIKAVTYHELKVENIRNQWQAKIIFDV
jgi:SHS2 domain-containing protein